jgi:L-asparaginase
MPRMTNSVGAAGTVAVLACGGTIQNTDSGRIGVETLLASLPSSARDRLPPIEVHDLIRTGSEDLEPTDWLRIAEAVARLAALPEIVGIVVTHGTYTAEESAYFVHLSVRTSKPIVFACSQRRHGVVGNDGDRNFIDAIRVAASAEAAGKGVLLVMGEEIHGARDVRKTNQRPGGFGSGSLGILGSIEVDQVTFYRQPTRRHTFDSEFADGGINELPRVDIVMAYPGADDALALAALHAGARGLVIEGYAPRGQPDKGQRRALDKAASEDIPIVLTSRGGEGRVPCDERTAVTGWRIGGDNLSPQKARILLMLALAQPRSAADMHRVFHQY